MTTQERHDNWMDSLRDLVDSGSILLFMFGGTICSVGGFALIGVMFTPEAEVGKLALYKEILAAIVGYISGAYSTMWNNQSFKKKVVKSKGES